ncbi:hypothetical protein TNCV_1439911 [Trichonephila clavipes]|nr:hypothetical protein TNCV_1439911 [Trichonephila clavipes]
MTCDQTPFFWLTLYAKVSSLRGVAEIRVPNVVGYLKLQQINCASGVYMRGLQWPPDSNSRLDNADDEFMTVTTRLQRTCLTYAIIIERLC